MTRILSRHGEQRLEALRALVRSSAATTSVYLRGALPGAGAQDLALRWQALRTDLADRGAPPEDLAALASAVAATPPGDHASVAFASAGELRLQAALAGYEGDDLGAYGRWPRAVPLLRWQQARTPALVAVVAHGGAETRAYDDDGLLILSEQIAGDDDEIERNAPGGWAQPRYQRRAVDSWMHNAEQFATRMVTIAAQVRPQVVLLAGDVRETALVKDRLPQELLRLVVDAVARPAPDAGLHVADDDVRTAVRTAARRIRAEAIDAFVDATGQGRAVQGAAEVLRALDQGRVERLVVVDGTVADDLADTAVAAALDAGSHITVAEPDDVVLAAGIGAALRY